VTAYEDITQAAKSWEEGFEPNGLTARPVRKLIVLSCMDARLDLFRMLGLEVGDAHILRNAGGRVTDDALRSVIVSTAALGTREVVVVHHTGCGLHGSTDDDMRAKVLDLTGRDPMDVSFHTFADEELSIRLDVAALRRSPYVPGDLVVWGALYNTGTGELKVVVPPEA
jgi:carbonic anhydrase